MQMHKTPFAGINGFTMIVNSALESFLLFFGGGGGGDEEVMDITVTETNHYAASCICRCNLKLK
jgi:hypothetical protein